MRILLNGAPHELPTDATVAHLVADLGLAPEQVAVERNGELVPRARHPEIVLGDGDQIEVVTLVGGG